MIFPVKRVKEELINEFAVSNMDIETFSQMHSIQPDALKSWIDEVMHPAPAKLISLKSFRRRQVYEIRFFT